MINALTDTISITQFNRGLAGKIFAEVKKSGAKVVIKNNKPECVLLAPDEYENLMEEITDARLLTLSQKRLSHYDRSTLISEEEHNRKYGITDKDLAGYEMVELE